MHKTLEIMGDLGIVPVATIGEAKDAIPLAEALFKGGLPIIEITFRTNAAEEAIREIASGFPKTLVGAGTILNVQQAERALKAGAQFVVSAGFNDRVVQYCLEQGVPVTPGCSTPTDITRALEFGLEVVKFFPAEILGGVKALEAMGKPFRMMKFVPTGGISPHNFGDYLALNSVWACGGSWMAKEELVREGNFGEITRLTREAVRQMLGFNFGHLGINMPDPETSMDLAKNFASAFDLPIREGNSSNFVGSIIELTKFPGPGCKGHIALTTKNMKRALAYLRQKGLNVDLDSARGPAGEPPVSIYLEEEIGGFAVHLLQEK